jgi:hypothetical protein
VASFFPSTWKLGRKKKEELVMKHNLLHKSHEELVGTARGGKLGRRRRRRKRKNGRERGGIARAAAVFLLLYLCFFFFFFF